MTTRSDTVDDQTSASISYNSGEIPRRRASSDQRRRDDGGTGHVPSGGGDMEMDNAEADDDLMEPQLSSESYEDDCGNYCGVQLDICYEEELEEQNHKDEQDDEEDLQDLELEIKQEEDSKQGNQVKLPKNRPKANSMALSNPKPEKDQGNSNLGDPSGNQQLWLQYTGAPAQKKLSDEDLAKYRILLDNGWTREVVIRAASASSTKKIGDIYYFTPDHKTKLRSSVEATNWLKKNPDCGYDLSYFCYIRQPILWPPGETVRLAVPRAPRSPNKAKSQPKSPKKNTTKPSPAPVPINNGNNNIPTENSSMNSQNSIMPQPAAFSTNEDNLVLGRAKRKRVAPSRFEDEDFVETPIKKKERKAPKISPKEKDKPSGQLLLPSTTSTTALPASNAIISDNDAASSAASVASESAGAGILSSTDKPKTAKIKVTPIGNKKPGIRPIFGMRKTPIGVSRTPKSGMRGGEKTKDASGSKKKSSSAKRDKSANNSTTDALLKLHKTKTLVPTIAPSENGDGPQILPDEVLIESVHISRKEKARKAKAEAEEKARREREAAEKARKERIAAEKAAAEKAAEEKATSEADATPSSDATPGDVTAVAGLSTSEPATSSKTPSPQPPQATDDGIAGKESADNSAQASAELVPPPELSKAPSSIGATPNVSAPSSVAGDNAAETSELVINEEAESMDSADGREEMDDPLAHIKTEEEAEDLAEKLANPQAGPSTNGPLAPPCSIRCPGRKGMLPNLLCCQCLCLYHLDCVPSGIFLTDPHRFVCPNCIEPEAQPEPEQDPESEVIEEEIDDPMDSDLDDYNEFEQAEMLGEMAPPLLTKPLSSTPLNLSNKKQPLLYKPSTSTLSSLNKRLPIKIHPSSAGHMKTPKQPQINASNTPFPFYKASSTCSSQNLSPAAKLANRRRSSVLSQSFSQSSKYSIPSRPFEGLAAAHKQHLATKTHHSTHTNHVNLHLRRRHHRRMTRSPPLNRPMTLDEINDHLVNNLQLEPIAPIQPIKLNWSRMLEMEKECDRMAAACNRYRRFTLNEDD